MNRLIDGANFIHNNMPDGTDWRAPVLSAADAWDVAAFVQAQPRPRKANLDRDYPNRLERPVDSAYGPYADGFGPEQHKLGHFVPIRAEIARRRAATHAAGLPAAAAEREE